MNSYIGNWPFRRLPYRTAEDIRKLMDRTETQAALVTPMAAIFYKDCLSAVQELRDDLDRHPTAPLWPVAVVNPAFPGWQVDLAIMIDQFGCVAVRLFPNYHNYRLTDPQAAALLALLQQRGLPVLVSPRVEPERLHHWLVKVAAVPWLDLTWIIRAFPELKIILCDLTPDEVDHLGEDIAVHPYASVDTSARMPQFYLEDLVAQLGADRVIFGTGMPLNYPDTALQMIMAAELTDDDRRKIFSQNAKRLFAIEFDRETEL